MHIKARDPGKHPVMRRAILRTLEASRFRADCRIEGGEIRIRNVRLREKKDYCGQHPGPCPVRPFGGPKKHVHASWLEGADWVGWNAMLNDLFDRYSWEADIWSTSMEFRGKMRVRRGRLRRIRYEAYEIVRQYGTLGTAVFMVWLAPGDDEDFEDWCGKKAPPAIYPDGTPGEAAWKARKNRARRLHGDPALAGQARRPQADAGRLAV